MSREGILFSLVTFIADWYKGVQAAACLAMITNLAGAATLALFTFVSSVSQKITKLSSVALLGLAGKCFCCFKLTYLVIRNRFINIHVS